MNTDLKINIDSEGTVATVSAGSAEVVVRFEDRTVTGTAEAKLAVLALLQTDEVSDQGENIQILQAVLAWKAEREAEASDTPEVETEVSVESETPEVETPEAPEKAKLTKAERRIEVARLVAEGETPKAIADALGFAERTIKEDIKAIEREQS